MLPEVPQPANARTNTKSNTQHAAFRDLPPRPNQKSGSGETRASTNPVGAGIHRALLVLTVIVVLCGAAPDTVAGAKVQPHPLGRPEQANDSVPLNPFSGATLTVMDPGVLCATVSVSLDNVSP